MRRTLKTALPDARRPSNKPIKVILVKWRDAAHQEDETDPIGTMLVWTVGLQVYRTKKEVALCMEVYENGSKRDITAIPMLNVKKILTLATIPFSISSE